MSDRTESQKAASRSNGQKSRGPKTAEGKLKSRQNALKHGLAAQVVLPPDLQAEVEAEILIYQRTLKPQGEFEQRLVQKAAVSSVKFLRLSHAELARSDERQRTAISEWDKNHEETAARLATIILSSTYPATEIERAEAYVQIQHTTAGLRLLAQAWDDLIDTLDEHHHWQDAHVQKAARLLGYFQPLKRPDTPPAFQALVDDAGTVLDALRGHAAPEDGASCLRSLRQLADDERTRLRAAADHLWQSREASSRAESLARALADTTSEGQLLQRYMNDAHRTEDQALKALAHHRRDQARERMEPVFASPWGEAGRRPGEGAASPATPQTNPSSTPESSAPTPVNPPSAAAHPPATGPAAA